VGSRGAGRLEASPGAGGTPGLRRVCIAGGGFARRYARAFHDEAGAEVVGVCARTPGSAAEVVAAAGGTAYTDFDTMLGVEEPDIVVVATPNHLHHPMTIAALTAGAEVICEKPLGLDAGQAEEMAACVVALERRAATAFTWRFLPACIALRSLLAEGRLGEIYQVDVRYHTRGFGAVHGPMRWQFDRSAAGSGALANLGSHAVDLVHWWLGPVDRVAAVTRTVIPHRPTAAGGTARVSVEDLSTATLVLADGTPVSLCAGWVAHISRVGLDVEVHGSKASAWLHYATGESPVGTLTVCDERTSTPIAVKLPDALNGEWVDLGQACVSRLVAAFLGGKASAFPGFDDGLRAQCVLDAILEAAAAARWIDVAYL
jgi:predicted dehydrogenase